MWTCSLRSVALILLGESHVFERRQSPLQICGRRKELGSFQGEEEAARCYDRHSVLAWGAR